MAENLAQNNYKLNISYDGTRYFGWERQPNKETIQGKIENVLSRMCNTEIEITGAGRTDAGVHAKAMIANVHMNTSMTEDEILEYMNRYLPDDIAVMTVTKASDRFHARYNAKGKTYCYTIFNGKVKPVFNRKYYTFIEEKLDVEAMREASNYLVGEHDFKSFCGNSKMKKSTIREIKSIDIKSSKGYIYLYFTGTGFLQYMVRILVGTLLMVGKGEMRPEEVKDVLDARDRTKAGHTAPAKGLRLEKVYY
ncbi:MAG: tRNA pseudouridine(38-40) synthase TruA [Lachnospiraceae bacterium]|nr:tRNA pseudouridine(38-40) synthase TruA [Lachnospiraceae bacterium]